MQKVYRLLRIIIFVSCLFVFANAGIVVKAQDTTKPPAIILYEIRGNEQEEGTLSKDIDSIRASAQPVTFLWTYTKLFDETAISLVRGLNTYQGGVLVEVDDQLLKEAGVTKDTLWPTSVRDVERTTILGYSQPDRRKLVDTLVRKYISVFGQAPQVAGSRIIDTTTANYLKDTYGIRFQLIDEEYKDKDHSMLDGGPSLIPYPASTNWLLVPDYANPDPVWVIRKPPQDIDHSLLGGDEISPVFIFSNLPFVNYVSELFDTYQPRYDLLSVLRVHISVSPNTLPSLRERTMGFFSYGNNNVKMYEIVTPVYRMRILKNKSDMWITDIRLYNKDLVDPYATRVAHYGYYMVVPYLLNETGWKEGKITHLTDTKNLTHLSLPSIDTSSAEEADVGTVGDRLAYIMQYNSNSVDGKKIAVVFNKDAIQIVGWYKSTKKLPYAAFPHPLNPLVESREGLFWESKDKKMFGANLKCRLDTCEITFNTHDISLYSKLSGEQSLFTFPEPELLNPNSKATLAGIEKAASVGEKTNISLVDQSQPGLSVVPSTKATILTSQPAILSPWQKDSIYEPSYFTLIGTEPADIEVSLTQGDRTLRDSITIIPNCSQNWLTCFKSPKSLFSYLFR